MIAAGITPHTIAASAIEIVSFLYGSDIEGSDKVNGRLDGLMAEKLPAIATNTLRCRNFVRDLLNWNQHLCLHENDPIQYI